MKTTIRNCMFNTDTDTVVGTLSSGMPGDSSWYEEVLYKAESGQYYICGRGSENSSYPTPVFKVMRKPEALAWLNALDDVQQLASV